MTIDLSADGAPAPDLRRNTLGTASLVVFVLGAAAPLTIVAGFAPLGLIAGGQALAVGFLFPAVVYLIFAVGFSAMSRHFNGYGAFYAYISRGLNERVGAAGGLVSYLGYLGGQVGFTAAASVFAASTIHEFTGVDLPWYVYAILFTAVVGFLSYRSVHVGARVLMVLLAAELGVLAVFCVSVLLHGGHNGLSLEPFSLQVMFSAALPSVFILTFTAFIGFEQTAIYSEEAKDPRRTVSRATYIAVAVLGIGYTFCAWTILQAAGNRLPDLLRGDPSTLIFALNSEYAGTFMTDLMHLLIVTSFFAGVLALQSACSRYLFALGRNGIVPRYLDHVGKSTGTPSTGNVVQAILTAAILIIFALFKADPYLQIVVWTNSPTIIAVLTMQILTSVAVIRFFRDDKRGESVWSRKVAPAAAVVLLTAALVLLVGNMSKLTGLAWWGNALVIAPLIVGGVVGYVRASQKRASFSDVPVASDRAGRAEAETEY